MIYRKDIKNFSLIIKLILCFSLLLPNAAFSISDPYKVGPGDRLTINIGLKGSLRDLSKISIYLPIQIVGELVYSSLDVIVGPDGRISVPTVSKSLKVTGLSLEEIEGLIAREMDLPGGAPAVSVSLVSPKSEAYYVWGEVVRPGRYVFEKPLTIIEGLSYAGGPTARAKLKKVILLKTDGYSQIIDLTPKRLLKEGSPNISLGPSDTVYVPKKWTTDMGIWFLLLAVIGTAATIKMATD